MVKLKTKTVNVNRKIIAGFFFLIKVMKSILKVKITKPSLTLEMLKIQNIIIKINVHKTNLYIVKRS